MNDEHWTHESNLTYHGYPFTFLLAAGDRPSQIVDKKHRTVCTVEPIWEPLGQYIATKLNQQALYRIEADQQERAA